MTGDERAELPSPHLVAEARTGATGGSGRCFLDFSLLPFSSVLFFLSFFPLLRLTFFLVVFSPLRA